MRDLYPALACEVMVELEFFFQFQCLVTTVRLSPSSPLGGVGS